MKHSFAIATLLASGFALSSAAQTAPAAAAAPAGPAKIAVIAFQAAVAQTNEGQRNFADLQKKYQPKENTLKAQNDAVSAAKASVDLIQRQYEAGAVGYVSLLTAQQAYQQARIAYVQAISARYTDTISLFQALGGGWWHRDELARL